MPVTLIESLNVGMQVWHSNSTNNEFTGLDISRQDRLLETATDWLSRLTTSFRSYARQHPCTGSSAASHLYATLLSLSGITLATTPLRHAGHGQSGPPCAEQACVICGQPGTAGCTNALTRGVSTAVMVIPPHLGLLHSLVDCLEVGSRRTSHVLRGAGGQILAWPPCQAPYNRLQP